MEALVVHCACWDYMDLQFDTFSQGGWNMNGGDTKCNNEKSQHDILILPVSTLLGLDDVIVVETSQARFARIISVLRFNQ